MISNGDGEAVLERGAVGIVGFLEQFGDLFAGEFHLFDGVAVAHCAVFAGVGEDLGAVDGDGDVADLQDLGAGGEFEHLVEGVGEQVTCRVSDRRGLVYCGARSYQPPPRAL